MRHVSLIVPLLLSATAVLAEDISAPSASGNGSSAQSVELARGSVSVGVDSGGSLDTAGGDSNGRASVSAGVLGLEVSAGLTSPSGDQLPDSTGGDTAGSVPDAASAAISSADTCAALTGLPLSIEQIGTLSPAGLAVIATCEGVDFGRAGRRAIEQNEDLSRHLAASGFTVRDVLGLSISGDGTAILVTRVYDRH